MQTPESSLEALAKLRATIPKVYIPTTGPDDWQRFLADPAKQWRTGFSAKRWRIAGSVRTEDYPTKSPPCCGRMEVRWNSCWLYQNIGWRFLELPEVKVRATSSLLRVLDIEHSRSRSKEGLTSPSAKLLAIGCKPRLMESASGSLSSVIYWA